MEINEQCLETMQILSSDKAPQCLCVVVATTLLSTADQRYNQRVYVSSRETTSRSNVIQGRYTFSVKSGH